MNEKTEKDPGLITNIKEYVNIRKDLAYLTIAEKASGAAAGIAVGSILGILGFFVILFANLALGFYLSEIIGNTYAGFLILTGLYLFISLIVFFTKDKLIKKPIENGVIKSLFKDRNEGSYEK
ncbi:MAG: phage holin family protein [Flavobacterium sp.]|nr:phage holin family protein [Pedobacter sp.]